MRNIYLIEFLIKLKKAGTLLMDLQEWYRSTNNIDSIVQELFNNYQANQSQLYQDQSYWFIVKLNTKHFNCCAMKNNESSFSFWILFCCCCCLDSNSSCPGSHRHSPTSLVVSFAGQIVERLQNHRSTTSHDANISSECHFL